MRQELALQSLDHELGSTVIGFFQNGEEGQDIHLGSLKSLVSLLQDMRSLTTFLHRRKSPAKVNTIHALLFPDGAFPRPRLRSSMN